MKAGNALFLTITIMFLSPIVFGQNQEQPPEKSPVELASYQAERMQKDLGLKDYQLFLVDSVLQRNYTDLKAKIEEMRLTGIQTRESYSSVQDGFAAKIDDAFEKIFDKVQFTKYLKMSGRLKLYMKRKEAETKKEVETK